MLHSFYSTFIILKLMHFNIGNMLYKNPLGVLYR